MKATIENIQTSKQLESQCIILIAGQRATIGKEQSDTFKVYKQLKKRTFYN